MRHTSSECLSPEQWTEWLDGTVSGLTHEVYQRHVKRCSLCGQKYASLSLAVGSLKELTNDDTETVPSFHLKVKRRLAWERGPVVPRRFSRWWVPVAVGLFIATLSMLTGRPDLSGKAQSYVDLYAEIYLRAEGQATNDFSPLVSGRGESFR